MTHDINDFKHLNEEITKIETYDDERKKKYLAQLKEQGWTDRDTWNLDVSFCQFIVPRLKRYKELYSERFEVSEEFINDIDKMIDAFSHVLTDKYFLHNECNTKNIGHALELFKKNFHKLWW